MQRMRLHAFMALHLVWVNLFAVWHSMALHLVYMNLCTKNHLDLLWCVDTTYYTLLHHVR